MHQDIANEIHANVQDEFVCRGRGSLEARVTTAQRATLLYRAALRCPHHVSRRSDCHNIEAPGETAEELFTMSLQALDREE